MSSQSLVFKGALIYVLRSQKGLARYHLVISYYDCFEKVLSSKIYYYCSLVDYAIDMSKLETYALLWMWLVIIFAHRGIGHLCVALLQVGNMKHITKS